MALRRPSIRKLAHGGWRRAWPALAVLAACAPWAAPTHAADLDFQVSGWWRARYHYYDGAPVDRTPAGQDLEYLDQRLTVDPQLGFGDWLTLKSRVDFVKDVIFGNNEASASILTGLARGTSNFTIGDDDAVETLDDLEIERLWAEIRTPVGLLRVGRQPSSWGLGILANSATDIEFGAQGNGTNSGGDTVDRVQLVTDLAQPLGWTAEHWIVSAAVDQATENSISRATDDVRQFVLATLYTDGAVTPRRVLGNQELGTYTVWVTGNRWDSDAVIFDGYARLASGSFFLEGEGVIGFGQTQRGGLIPGEDKDTLEDDLVEGLAEDFVETLNGSLSLPDALNYARNGFPEFLQTFVASSLLDSGFSPDTSLAIAQHGAAAGIPSILDDQIDVLIAGGVVRGGWTGDGFSLTTEVGYSSPPDGDDDFAAPRVGPEGAENDALNLQIVDAIDDLKGEGALTHRNFGSFPFDQEYDVALLLYDVVGPINPASGLPTVINTSYGKLTGVWQATEQISAYASAVAGWLNRPVLIVTNKRHPADPPVFVHDEDDTNEIVSSEDFLGVELDAGITWQPHPNIKGELKGGYLFTGATFGPNRSDVFGIRPQFAILF